GDGLGHGVRGVPHDSVAHDPAVVLEGDGQPLGDEHEVLRRDGARSAEAFGGEGAALALPVALASGRTGRVGVGVVQVDPAGAVLGEDAPGFDEYLAHDLY